VQWWRWSDVWRRRINENRSRHVVFILNLYFVTCRRSKVEICFVSILFLKRADEREKTVKCFVKRRQPHPVSLKKFLAAIVRPSPHCARSFFVRRTYWPILSGCYRARSRNNFSITRGDFSHCYSSSPQNLHQHQNAQLQWEKERSFKRASSPAINNNYI
jgi:hypothetical protein